ncbi:MAG TPA: helix-turn-helix domain-containing protein [Candidatus Nanoarchaeia archaeon]|nr:helix-turn-helix domain-containing protein [Candidatus Nanoarchaeia archaeon]
MASKKDLEETLKGKISPLLEETMEKSWGITIPQLESDITDKLKNPQLQIYVSPHLPFSTAKKKFKSEFLKKELRLHLGNISHLAKTLGIDRRSIHRAIKSLEIDIESARYQEVRTAKEEEINATIRTSLEQYKEFIQPQQMEKMYAEVPALSRNIAQMLPHTDIGWKEAEKEFEKQFLAKSLKEHGGNVIETAKQLRIRVETLYRKMKKLGL